MGPIEQLDAVIPTLDQLLDGTTPEQLEAKTPCDEWVVRDLLGHLNGGGRMFAAAFEGRAPNERDLGDDPVGTTRAALAEFDTAVRSPGALEREVQSPFGPMPGEQFARIVVVDILMHSWDLARATGQPITVPDEVLAVADGFARQAITPELRAPGLFGPEVSAPSASGLESLAAFTGRQP